MAPEDLKESEPVKLCLRCNQTYTGRVICPKDGNILSPLGTQIDPFVGTLLADKYKIISVCGRGGMGLVYKARQQLIDRIVAIKMLKADLLGDEQSVRRFQLEAKAASRLQHPNVVTVHDFGVVESTAQPYLVMDYIEGESLAEIIKRDGRLNVRRAVPIFVQTCSALEHAHRQHVVHRDVKPSNIVLVKTEDTDDFVKVVDFGIAKLTSLSGTESMHLTKTGEVFGSPIYMSPEQCQGLALDARSDIYSLGATMYESLVGFPPLVGKTLVDTMHKHINETPPSLRATWPELCVPEGIERVIMKALEKDKELRYDSMLEMKEALEFAFKRFLAENDGAPEPVTPEIRLSSPSARQDPRKDLPSGKMHRDTLRSARTSTPAAPASQSIIAALGVLSLLVIGVVTWYVCTHMVGSAATGVLFYLEQGADNGKAHIMTVPGGNMLKLSFQTIPKEHLKGKLAGKNGAANGAIWTVNFHRDGSGLVLDDVHFDSGFDESVQAADLLVRRHYRELAHGNYREAYDDLSPEWQHKQPYEKFEAGNKPIEYEANIETAPPQAIKITGQTSAMIELLANLKYFTGASDEYCRFSIRNIDGRWRIDKCEKIKKDEWDAAFVECLVCSRIA